MKITTSEFKVKSSKLLNEIHNTGEIIIITQNGVPIAKVLPINDSATKVDLKGTLVYQDEDLNTSLSQSHKGSQRKIN